MRARPSTISELRNNFVAAIAMFGVIMIGAWIVEVLL
jgi:hypothetical protein